MLIYSDSFYVSDNGNGYALDTRDAICSKCHKVIDRQEKYRNIDKEFGFSKLDKNEWMYCPYCGEKLSHQIKGEEVKEEPKCNIK